MNKIKGVDFQALSQKLSVKIFCQSLKALYYWLQLFQDSIL